LPHYSLCLDSDCFPNGGAQTPFEADNDRQAVADALVVVANFRAKYRDDVSVVRIYTLEVGRLNRETCQFDTYMDRKLYDSNDLDASIEILAVEPLIPAAACCASCRERSQAVAAIADPIPIDFTLDREAITPTGDGGYRYTAVGAATEVPGADEIDPPGDSWPVLSSIDEAEFGRAVVLTGDGVTGPMGSYRRIN
jgi:hypothetical protein